MGRSSSATVDFMANGRAYGQLATRLKSNGFGGSAGFDVGNLRPFLSQDGRTSFVSLYNGKDKKGNDTFRNVKLQNAQASLLRQEWKWIDSAVVEAAQPELVAWDDLRRSSRLVIPRGMSKTVVESARINDISPAKISMDGITVADMDIPEADMVGTPLPIIHKDFKFTRRQIEVSREGRIPLDTTPVQMATIKVAQEVEKMTIGIGAGAGYKYAGYEIQGYTTFADRITYELTDPTASGWTPKQLIKEVIAMRKAAEDAGYKGEFTLYISNDWAAVMDEDYSDAKGSNTVRQRVQAIEGIGRIVALDYLSGYQMILVKLTPTVARAIIGMPMTVLQWELQGGMEVRMKVMAIMVPQLRSDFYGGTGIVHGNVADAST